MAFGKIGKTLSGIFKKKKTDGVSNGISETTPDATEHVPQTTGPTASVSDDERLHGGLPTPDYFVKYMLGNPKNIKSKRMNEILDRYRELHEDLDKRVTINWGEKATDLLDESTGFQSECVIDIERVLYKITDVIAGREKKNSKEITKYVPALASLMSSLLMVIPKVAGMRNYLDDYLQEIGGKPKDVSYAEVLSSMTATAFVGNRVDTTYESDTTAATGKELSAYEKYLTTDEEENDVGKLVFDMRNTEDKIKVVENLRIPFTDYKDPKGAVAALNRIIQYIDDLDMRTTDMENLTSNRAEVRSYFTVLMRVLVSAVNQWQLQIEGQPHKIDAIEQIMGFASEGYTVKDALDALLKKEDEDVYQVGADEYVTGGVLSNVNIGESVHRASKNTHYATHSKPMQDRVAKWSVTGNNDEAMHKLAEAMGFGEVIAKSTGVSYKDKEGVLRHGTNMERAKGKTLGDIGNVFSKNSSLGHDVYDENDPASMKFLENAIKLSLVDYVAQHVDRHAGNFFIDSETMDIKGIDNDTAFGTGVSVGEDVKHGLEAPGGKSTKLADAVSYITPDIKKKVQAISISKVDNALLPYINKHQRKRVIMRLMELKKAVEKCEVVDFSSPGVAATVKLETFSNFFGKLKLNKKELLDSGTMMNLRISDDTYILNRLVITAAAGAKDGGRAMLREYFDELDILHNDEIKVKFFGSLSAANKKLEEFYKVEAELGRPAS